MKRKIVQHGSSSLTITLPIKWAEKFGLRKGDELAVDESGSQLVISTTQSSAVQKKEFSADESGIFTKNNLSHLYQLGYDEIEIRYKDPKTLLEIKERLPDCIGFELLDQRDGKVYIKSIATTIETEFDTLLRKSFLIANEMARGILQALKSGELYKLSEIRSLESLNNRFTDVCIRILNKRGYKNQKRLMQMYEIVKTIERIADEFKHICDLYAAYAKKIDDAVIKDYKAAMDYYLAFYNMFYQFDPKQKEFLYGERKKLLLKFNSVLEQSRGKQCLLYHHLMNLVEKTYEGAGAYFALVL